MCAQTCPAKDHDHDQAARNNALPRPVRLRRRQRHTVYRAPVGLADSQKSGRRTTTTTRAVGVVGAADVGKATRWVASRQAAGRGSAGGWRATVAPPPRVGAPRDLPLLEEEDAAAGEEADETEGRVSRGEVSSATVVPSSSPSTSAARDVAGQAGMVGKSCA